MNKRSLRSFSFELVMYMYMYIHQTILYTLKRIHSKLCDTHTLTFLLLLQLQTSLLHVPLFNGSALGKRVKKSVSGPTSLVIFHTTKCFCNKIC